ncbi:MAG: PDZ domain-containing protein [Acidobacteria bacterium]|nr:PDZ domain-containing protein [Acidobacteriota bacterium]
MAQEFTMTSRGRILVLVVSIPIMAYAVIGGFMGKADAQSDSYRYLRIFEDVVTLILNSYVEDVNVEMVMHGAMHGIADGLDPDTAYLTADQVKAFHAGPPDAVQVGIELTRQYYLRVIATREGSPAAAAGIRPGDFIRSIDGEPTRDTTVFEGMRALAGTPGTKVTLAVLRGNAAEPHEVTLVRRAAQPRPVTGRVAAAGVGVLRVPEFTATTTDELRRQVAVLTKAGAGRLVIDLRGTAFGDKDHGIAAARLFVNEGTLAFRQDRQQEQETIAAHTGAATITLPTALLVDSGTSGAAELFAAALDGNGRAALVGEHTQGRAADQTFVPLPDGSGLLITHLLYLAPDGAVIHGKGLAPDVAVEQPSVEFGAALPEGDPTLDQAIEHLTAGLVAA